MQEAKQQEFERQIAPQKVALFERQFGENYRLLAYHAALPLVLTPELVHYLRTEFLLDRVPWEAEADLLLSDLCSQVGYELYAMDTAVRSYLLEQMQTDDRIPPDRMQAVAKVLMSYVQYLSHLNPGQRERELQVQRWAAMTYLGDEHCRQMADEIVQQFAASGGKGSSTAVKAEFARLARITQELEPQLQAHPELVEFAKRVGQVLRSPETITPEEQQQGIRMGDRLFHLFGEGWNFPPLRPLNFTVAKLVDSDEGLTLPLQTEQFTVATITLEPETSDRPSVDLQPFEFTVATPHQRLMSLGKNPKPLKRAKWEIQRQQQQALQFIERLADDLILEMVSIPAGEFLMGSPPEEPERYDDENSQHSVEVPAFYMGRYPVTQAQWRFVAALSQVDRPLEADPSRFKGDDRPVEKVSWHDATEFCARLSQHTGRSYRLPTEAEWEYACRAGTTTPFHFGETIVPDLANYDWKQTYNQSKVTKEKDFEGTTPVDRFGVANDFGLCDMHGNVWEWCEDHWHGNYEGAPANGSAWLDEGAEEDARRVLRGGSWDYDPRDCRSASRIDFGAGSRYTSVGFRVVCFAPRTFQPSAL